MKRSKLRGIAFLLAACILLGSFAVPVRADNPGGVKFLNTYVNTGNQRQDILGVAMTQVGYEEKYENDTKYGDWYGFPGYAWCAMFVAWCARQAEVSTDILRRISWAHPNSFGIPYYHGSEYTPLPGDLFFTEDFSHVGLVLYTDGEFFYCVEGNAKPHDYTVPNDPTVDSYHVMTNKRLISAHYFGVPAYEGCDKDHDYERGVDATHPHKVYYKCRICGDKFYTGYTECLSACGQCLSCSCSASYAGYYLVSSDSDPVNIRSGHSASSDSLGYATSGEAVYVYGADPGSGRAYIEYDGNRGHVWFKYLTKYYDIPAAPTVTTEKAEYVQNDDVTVNWTAPAHTEQYRLKVFKDGALYTEKVMDLATSCKLEALAEGMYEVQVIACNRSGASEAGVLKFTVRNTYTVSYDACGGSGAPEAQTQVIGEPVAVSSTVPSWEGYTFLGWTEEAQGKFASYNAGSVLNAYQNITLYAVWKQNDAVPQTMEIRQMPTRTAFLRGEALDTSGLVLAMTYSDGSGCPVKEGFSTEGFDSETYGTKTVTVAYEGMTAAYDIQIVPYLPGDIDLNKRVDRDDVMQLLWHISFPDRFPISTPADFNSDSTVNRDDVMQLLWHISFPDRFTLDIVWPEEEAPEETVPEETVPEETVPEETEAVDTQSGTEGE